MAEPNGELEVPNSEGDVTTLAISPVTKDVSSPLAVENAGSIAAADPSGMQSLITAKISQLEGSKPAAKFSKKNAGDLRQFLFDVLTNTSTTPETKLKLLHQKYAGLLTEARQLEKELHVKSKRVDQLAREKDAFSAEAQKSNAMRTKLETLCRELQRQNKTLLEESRATLEGEHNKRAELTRKFQDSIQDIQSKMDLHYDERQRIVKENDMWREKLRGFTEQYELREKHVETIVKTKDLELQLMAAKLKQQQEMTRDEHGRVVQSAEQIGLLQTTERELRAQLALYAEKFELFQDTLTKSNEVFNTFKHEMEKMTKQLAKSQKENTELRKKCEQTDVALLELAEERNKFRRQADDSKKQADASRLQTRKLEDLCRALQVERNSLRQELQQLKSGGPSQSASGSESLPPDSSASVASARLSTGQDLDGLAGID